MFGGETLLLGAQASFRVSDSPVPQFSGTVEVVGALSFLRLPPQALQLTAQLLDLADRLTLRLPLGALGVRLRLQVGQFPAQLLQPVLAGSVRFLRQRRFLDLQAGHPPGQLVELSGH